MPKAVRDLGTWIETDVKHLKKLHRLIVATLRTPYEGIGEPERLKHTNGKLWSRRVSMQHRMVYEVEGDDVVFYSLHGHYWANL
jgi:toxin YoeB